MTARTVKILGIIIVLSITFTLLSGCSPLYVMRAAYEESKILIGRQYITQVLQEPDTSAEERHKLALVLAARDFAQTLSLEPGRTFTTYSRVEGEAVAWVVSASPPDAFQIYQWWFPIVGSVPYKGFFDKEDAEEEARSLEAQGYETWVRGTEAFSTLGWFNDPLLTTTLRHHPVNVTNTVLHEILHSTLWVPNYVSFNESLANFVGHQANIDFFKHRLEQCPVDDAACIEQAEQYYDLARRALTRELVVADTVDQLYSSLEQLYSQDIPKEAKLERRVQLFTEITAPMRAQVGEVPALAKVNNARIMQLRLYLQKLATFQEVFRMSTSWPDFVSRMRTVKDEAEHGSDPFESLSKLSQKS